MEDEAKDLIERLISGVERLADEFAESNRIAREDIELIRNDDLEEDYKFVRIH